jgi:hypothetical protein
MSREVTPQAVKEVPAEDFIKAYAAHLKSTDKVRRAGGRRGRGAGSRAARAVCSREAARATRRQQAACIGTWRTFDRSWRRAGRTTGPGRAPDCDGDRWQRVHGARGPERGPVSGVDARCGMRAGR